MLWVASRGLAALEFADKRRASYHSRRSRGGYPYYTYRAKLIRAFDYVCSTVHEANAPV